MATKQEKEQKNIKNIQFAWIGKDKNKNEVRGEMISSSESAVRMLLRSKGITPIKVSKKGFKLNKEKKITTAEIAVLIIFRGASTSSVINMLPSLASAPFFSILKYDLSSGITREAAIGSLVSPFEFLITASPDIVTVAFTGTLILLASITVLAKLL